MNNDRLTEILEQIPDLDESQLKELSQNLCAYLKELNVENIKLWERVTALQEALFEFEFRCNQLRKNTLKRKRIDEIEISLV